MAREWITGAAAVVALALGAGCFNGSRNVEVAGESRLELIVESDRTDVDATHFLLDAATGDLWRLEVGGGAEARWVRLASGPDDLQELEPEAAPAGTPTD